MSLRPRITLRGPVLGFIDGIMNALALTAGSILRADRPVTAELTVQISLFAATTGFFVIFVSGYVALRAELVRASRQLNLTGSGRLAATQLGRTIVREAGWEATAGGIASFLGCLVPLAVAWAFPNHGWVGILTAFAMLAGLGVVLANLIQGRKSVWSILLIVGGVALTMIGLWLEIA